MTSDWAEAIADWIEAVVLYTFSEALFIEFRISMMLPMTVSNPLLSSPVMVDESDLGPTVSRKGTATFAPSTGPATSCSAVVSKSP